MNVTFANTVSYNHYTPRQNTAPSFRAQAPDKFIRTGMRVIANEGRSNGVMAEEPMRICEFLDGLCGMKMFEDRQEELKMFSEGLSSAGGLQELKVKQLIGYGSSALALELKNGKILKLSKQNHFPMNRPAEDFDAKVFARGKAGKIHYYVAEKCTPCESGQGYADIMREKIRAKGYRPSDLGTWDDFQVGFNSRCELKLLDPECAKYKTPVHKLVQVISNFFKQSI